MLLARQSKDSEYEGGGGEHLMKVAPRSKLLRGRQAHCFLQRIARSLLLAARAANSSGSNYRRLKIPRGSVW